MALPLLQAVVPPKRLIADKAYDAQSLRDGLKSKRIIATIPSTATRSAARPIAAATGSSASSITSRTGGASPRAMIGSPATTSPPSHSPAA
jgi:hypothetical protein